MSKDNGDGSQKEGEGYEGAGLLGERQGPKLPGQDKGRVNPAYFAKAEGGEVATPVAELEQIAGQGEMGLGEISSEMAERVAAETAAEFDGTEEDYLKECDEASAKRKRLETNGVVETLEKSIKSLVYGARSKAMEAVEGRMHDEAEIRFKKYRAADNKNAMYKALMAVKRFLTMQKKEKLPASIDDVLTGERENILSTVVSNLDGEAVKRKGKLDKHRAYFTKRKDEYQEKVDTYEDQIIEHMELYEQGDARGTAASTEIERLKLEKQTYAQRLEANPSDKEAKTLSRNACLNLKTQRSKLKTVEKGKRKMDKELGRMENTINGYLRNLYIFEASEEVFETEVDQLDSSLQELRKVLQDDKERQALIEAFETLGQSRDLQEVIQKVYGPGIEAVTDIITLVTKEQSSYTNRILQLQEKKFKDHIDAVRTQNSDAYDRLKERFG